MFGAAFRKQHFTSLDENVVQVNHGSFGLAPDCVYEAAGKASAHEWSYPEEFLRDDVIREYPDVIKDVAEVLQCDYRNIALVENATSAINVVLRSFPFKRGDKIVYLKSTIYGACEKTLAFLEDYLGIVPVPVEITYPIEDADLVEAFATVLSREKPKMAFFDAISSMPGVRVPFEELVCLCKQTGVLSHVDGAHSIGAIPLNLGDLQPDFFVSNLHKWLFVPRGCAVLYVNPAFHDVIQTFPISWTYKKTGAISEGNQLSPPLGPDSPDLLVSKFSFVGTTNYTQRFAIKTALQFRKDVCGGEQKIYDYCHGLAVEVGERLSRKYDTSYLENSTKTLTTVMVNVELPNVGMTVQEYVKNQREIESKLHAQMLRKKTFVPLVVHGGKIYARFSCQVYNEYSDFETAMGVVVGMLRSLKSKL